MQGWHASGCRLNSWSGQKTFLIEVIENLSLHSKELELGQDVLRYSNTDSIMAQSGSKINLSSNRSEN